MKLPFELRRRVYIHHTGSLMARIPSGGLISFPKVSKCECFGSVSTTPQPIEMPLARLCKELRREYLYFFYFRFPLYFTCTCELYSRLQSNHTLRRTVRDLCVHWVGSDSDKAFQLLAACHSLTRLNIRISKATTYYQTPREQEMRMFFRAQKPARLEDALGMDELLALRGIKSVMVSHLQAKQGARRCEEDRSCLQTLLRSKLTLPAKTEASVVTDVDDENA